MVVTLPPSVQFILPPLLFFLFGFFFLVFFFGKRRRRREVSIIALILIWCEFCFVIESLVDFFNINWFSSGVFTTLDALSQVFAWPVSLHYLHLLKHVYLTGFCLMILMIEPRCPYKSCRFCSVLIEIFRTNKKKKDKIVLFLSRLKF